MTNREIADGSVQGRIHSIETFGTVDGPGIRFVLFMQGCALRCQYCHNPDSWERQDGKLTDVEQVLAEIEPYVDYYKGSGGGITVTGGEPTLQAGFVAALFRECKRRFGLHTALDSSGFSTPDNARELLAATDLVLLDLKQLDPERHIALTTQPNERILAFAKYLSDNGHQMWVRHVLIPGVTDRQEDLVRLGEFIRSLQGVLKFELLPYHRMGVYKWQELGLSYPLEGVKTPTDMEVSRAKRLINV
ncbi:pyruvate formate lyase-activating protein [Paenibacillaceae bacterium]|nr:pyruvate formate lyase-activating protein [Paenibacillaceae bacterium]